MQPHKEKIVFMNMKSISFANGRLQSQRAIFERLRSPEALLIGSAILVGAVTGLSAIIFIWLLARIGALSRWVEANAGGVLAVLLFMAVAGAIVGFLIDHWAKEAKGHGVPEVMEAIALRGGRIRAPVAAIKVLASAITIGAGGSAGREGPIVQVGSALGSVIGQRFQFSEERIRTLVACGSAAGIAATFNAPIAGAIFALEVILGRFTVRYFGAVVISAVSASVVAHQFLGNDFTFEVPSYQMNHLAEIPVYIVLGVLSALWAVLFIRVLYKTEGVFDHWRVPLPVKTALGMVLTGLVALLITDRAVLGPGLELIEVAIAKDVNFTVQMLGALLVLKLLATTFTLGSGNSGGVFAPSLFMGAVLGGIVGTVANMLWPEVVVHPGAYALVGMAAVFSGAARAPITAVLIVFEMSGDYQLILPLMLATVLSTLLAEMLFKDSIYTFKLTLKGIRLDRGRDEDILQGVSVQDVMVKQPVIIPADASVSKLLDLLTQTHHHGLPVIDADGQLWGIVTVSDLDPVQSGTVDIETLTVADIATPAEQLAVCYPDESIGQVLRRMSRRGFGRLPVVSRENHRHLEGFINRETIIKAYDVGLIRRANLQNKTQQMQLKNLDGTEFVQYILQPEQLAVGKTIQQLAPNLPHECVLVSIRRNGRLLIPHGDTVLMAGDQITAFVDAEERASLQACLDQDKTETAVAENSYL